MMRSTLTVLAALAAASTVSAQQVLEIDYGAGRVLIDDDSRAIYDSSIDHQRAILYLQDMEEPEGVMVFSLDTGEWIRTIRFPTGGGPGELPQGYAGMSAGRNGRLYVSGLARVLMFDDAGQYIGNWTPRAPERRGAVCDFDGEPAVPAIHGVVRRSGDGDETVGPGVAAMRGLPRSQARAMGDLLWSSRIACTPNAAYVVTTHADDTDSLTVYYRSGRMGTLQIPAELVESGRLTTGPRINTDGRGNVVLAEIPDVRLIRIGGYQTVGAVLDPGSGCHATIRNPEVDAYEYSFRGIHADSAVVAVLYMEEGEEMGRKALTFFDHAYKVGLYPLRRVSGEPCPGMLPTVEPVRSPGSTDRSGLKGPIAK